MQKFGTLRQPLSGVLATAVTRKKKKKEKYGK
jgi:hypothetical protein